MAVGVVPPSTSGFTPMRPLATSVAAPQAPAAAYATDNWSTNLPVPAQPAPVGVQAAAGTTNYGQLAAWGLGALGAVRFALPHLSGGWIKAAAVLGGALIGNIAWKKMETEVQKDTDAAIKRIDEALRAKEVEIMQV